MSRIGKKPVAIPNGVTVTIDGQTVTVKGPKGQLAWTLADEVTASQADGAVTLEKRDESQRSQAMWGLSRSLVAEFRSFWREFFATAFRPYHPERHYMRGPGPACAAKRRSQQP